jgi:uncharacterized damage-inducible protein DinB
MTDASSFRRDPETTGDERATLTGFLDYHRGTLEWKCAGLTPEQLARRAIPPSTLSLLGIVRHLADVERSWFRRRLASEAVPPIFFTETEPDLDFDGAVADSEVVATAFSAWRREVARARDITSAVKLGDTFAHPGTGETLSVRWVLTHMIEEYARHNGHADLLREAIDGQTGE